MHLPGVLLKFMGIVDAIAVEVVYALPEQAYLIPLKVKVATTIGQAIELSGLLQKCPEIDLAQCTVGIYGRLKDMGTVLQAGDRVEIYRPLKVDPKVARRKRAEKKNQEI